MRYRYFLVKHHHVEQPLTLAQHLSSQRKLRKKPRILIRQALTLLVIIFSYTTTVITTGFQLTSITTSNILNRIINRDRSSSPTMATMTLNSQADNSPRPIVIFNSPLLSSSSEATTVPTALIILNQPLPFKISPNTIFARLWNGSQIKICADGGANRLHDAAKKWHSENKNDDDDAWCPDAIVGDLDSLRDDVKEYYKSRNCHIEKNPDQESNDLDKAITFIRNSSSLSSSSSKAGATDIRVCVYGAFGGRFDQDMASIQALYRWCDVFRRYGVFLYTEETSAVLLHPFADNEIYVEKNIEGPSCGLIPMGGRCEVVTTEGLQWDLDGRIPLEFGGLVSTSNSITGNVVKVSCSRPLVWTVEIRASEERCKERS